MRPVGARARLLGDAVVVTTVFGERVMFRLQLHDQPREFDKVAHETPRTEIPPERHFFEIVPAVGKNRGGMYGLDMRMCGEIVALLPIVVGASGTFSCRSCPSRTCSRCTWPPWPA